MRTLLTIGAAVLVSTASFGAQAPTTVFRGRPAVKISEGGVERTPEQVPRERAVNLECVISRIGNSYYWASRENVQMSRTDGGAFTTYVAVNGAGYVRVLNPEAKAAASAMSGTEKDFDYVEHALVGLRSVTYYGTRQ
jgi:hypothetical protein